VVAINRLDKAGTRCIPVTQITAPGMVSDQEVLPSVLYAPHIDEFEDGSVNLPWAKFERGTPIVGTLARERGVLVPDRVVTSAKSWLCNQHVDRKADILPWKSEAVEKKFSPFEVSRRYLDYLRMALQHAAPELGSAERQVVLTVPASFDEVARSLTHEAAQAAGWSDVVLLEEPQAAFYAWIESHGEKWREQIEAGDLVLICDVGGGTADFSLIAVKEVAGNLELERISVGEHILLGGDNMDLSLAYEVRQQLEAAGQELDNWQFLSLIHSARLAKERLLGDESLEEVPVSIPTRGSSLFAKTISAKVTREVVARVILDGFLPLSQITDLPAVKKSVGLQEFGLAYAAEPALSRHLARFLHRSYQNVASDPKLREVLGASMPSEDKPYLLPKTVLFNGGVFKSKLIRERLIAILNGWRGDGSVRVLDGESLDLAVARGAAYYGSVALQGQGLRIKSGSARSYYLGLESSGPAVPGYQPPIKGVCIVPQGMEEGTRLKLEKSEFGLVTGESVSFRLFSSAERAGDAIGSIVDNAARNLAETSSLTVSIPATPNQQGEMVPVLLNSVMTEVGTLELWMEGKAADQKWKLEFNLRSQPA
jgi:molecular chaperone DnaK (HSP70)